MSVVFRSTVGRGAAKGKEMVPWLDKDENFVLLDPQVRQLRGNGTVYASDCVRTRSATTARILIEKHGFSMRMQIRGSNVPPSMVRASRITIVDGAGR